MRISGRFWSVSLWLFSGAAILFWLILSYGYIEDDAFIHLEFARSLGEGLGFAFNGRVVNGDTAPLWVILLTAVHALGFGWVGAAKALCGVGALIALSGVWRIASELSEMSPRHRYLAPAAVLLTAVNPYFVHWSFSGMESVSALGIGLWAMWATFSTRTSGWPRRTLAAVLLAVAPLLRPELLLLSGVSGAALLLQAWRSRAATASAVVAIVLLAIVMALPTILWATYSFESFGSIVPNTNAAKRGGSLLAVALKLGSVYMMGFAGTIGLMAFVTKRLLKPGVPAIIWALLLWPAGCVVFYLADHTAVQTRYCLLSMPSMTIAVLWLLQETVWFTWFRGVVAAMTTLSLGTVIAIVYPHVSNKVKLVQTVSGAAAFIREELPPQAPIAVYAIGQIAFESRHPLIDIGGITRPGVLAYMGDLPATIRWARSQGAEYYIGGESPGPTAVSIYKYAVPFLGWSFRHADYKTSVETAIYRWP